MWFEGNKDFLPRYLEHLFVRMKMACSCDQALPQFELEEGTLQRVSLKGLKPFPSTFAGSQADTSLFIFDFYLFRKDLTFPFGPFGVFLQHSEPLSGWRLAQGLNHSRSQRGRAITSLFLQRTSMEWPWSQAFCVLLLCTAGLSLLSSIRNHSESLYGFSVWQAVDSEIRSNLIFCSRNSARQGHHSTLSALWRLTSLCSPHGERFVFVWDGWEHHHHMPPPPAAGGSQEGVNFCENTPEEAETKRTMLSWYSDWILEQTQPHSHMCRTVCVNTNVGWTRVHLPASVQSM